MAGLSGVIKAIDNLNAMQEDDSTLDQATK